MSVQLRRRSLEQSRLRPPEAAPRQARSSSRSACSSAWSPSRPSRRPTTRRSAASGSASRTAPSRWPGRSATPRPRPRATCWCGRSPRRPPARRPASPPTAPTPGIVNASYAGPGTLVAPGASVAAATTGIPGSTTGSVTLSVTGYWSYGSTVVETRTASVDLGCARTVPLGRSRRHQDERRGARPGERRWPRALHDRRHQPRPRHRPGGPGHRPAARRFEPRRGHRHRSVLGPR